MMAPPLFQDWEELHRADGQERLPIPECWRRTKRSILLHNALTFCGNLALIAALIVTRGAETIDFQHGGDTIPIMVGGIGATLGPPVLIWLSHVYFRQYHPWARILDGELRDAGRSPKSVTAPQSEGESEPIMMEASKTRETR